ncbi:IS30 family transposase [Mycoplasmopsis gallinacea]|uniref:IS30 family transposase n=1 Tax=Mycoplasmopsis gallinacea TaxID=29556 RepID=A0A6H0V6F9_9BACT|nr:IS30 family transposase [Mycoplasmopsis gallinacea]QIW62563.1 IS30 family transposase [Mycoplasmopsis gallinacea]
MKKLIDLSKLNIICVKNNAENFRHFIIKETDDEIKRLHSNVSSKRLLRDKQISILLMWEIILKILVLNSVPKAAKYFGYQSRTIKQKMEIMIEKNNYHNSLKNKVICKNCGSKIFITKFLSFRKLSNHLLSYKIKRLMIVSESQKNKWSHFKKYWNDVTKELRKKANKNSKNIKCKMSVKFMINSFKQTNPNAFCPTFSTVYKALKQQRIKLSFDPLLYLSRGGYTKTTLKQGKRSLIHARDLKYRPKEANLRLEKGHFEADTVVGKREDKFVLFTLLDRKTRELYIALTKRDAKSINKALRMLIRKYNLEIKTLTVDKGSENTLLHKVVGKKKLFKCKPYASYQKGSIENAHRYIRRFIPKGKSFNSITQEYVFWLKEQIDEYKRILAIKN